MRRGFGQGVPFHPDSNQTLFYCMLARTPSQDAANVRKRRCRQRQRRGLACSKSKPTISNVASRLCDEAKRGPILISPRVLMAVEDTISVEPIGDFKLKGISRPLAAYNVLSAASPKNCPSGRIVAIGPADNPPHVRFSNRPVWVKRFQIIHCC
jgi:hypothetical protein